jgi:hypothetical protein
MVWYKPWSWSNAKVAPEPEERVEDDDEGWFDDPDDDDEVEAEAVEAEQQAAAEITNDASMKRVIIEEWEGLEFGPTTRPCGRTWIGINALCRMFPKVCKDVVAKGGWDSKYM